MYANSTSRLCATNAEDQATLVSGPSSWTIGSRSGGLGIAGGLAEVHRERQDLLAARPAAVHLLAVLLDSLDHLVFGPAGLPPAHARHFLQHRASRVGGPERSALRRGGRSRTRLTGPDAQG